ncbi:MAG: 3-deoxy-7-phosphoheptulonate synthase, partial [Candidatus Polarisedimenticolaceae bacterium]|nr:3-deoxy-7-phosphoheptulonate synthase [Candidatus Polarisedimenticolaceae bacterium]
MKHRTDDLRINEIKELMSPAQVHDESPITTQAADTVFQARHEIQQILQEKDDRLVVVIGPCSVHDSKAALEYASKLAPLQKDLKD